MTRVYDEVELGYLRDVLAGGRLGWLAGGMVTRFETAFAALVGSRCAVARSSGTAALIQALALGGVGPGAEVVCDPLVHFGGMAALARGAAPRFADVRPGTFNLDPGSVRAAITPRTRALVVTNLWGLCAELDELRRVCDEHGLLMVEDCAHALLSRWRGRHAGTFGHVGTFSFQHHKQLSTGDGGMLVTDSPDLARQARGEGGGYCEVPDRVAPNYRMNELTAAVGLAQLARLEGYVADYTRGLATLDQAIAGCRWLRAREVPPGAEISGHTWAAVWEGDRFGLSYDRFRASCQAVRLPIDLGLGGCGRAASAHALFRGLTAGEGEVGTRGAGERAAPTPVADDLARRLVAIGLVELPDREVARRAAKLGEAIRLTER